LTDTNSFSYVVSGTGTGTVSISIPYTLFVSCSAASDDGVATAYAQVLLSAFGPWSYLSSTNPWATCDQTSSTTQGGTITQGGTLTRSGVMTISQAYTYQGSSFPYVPGYIDVVTHAGATAGTTQVPEPSSLILLVVGLAGIAAKFR
jgi:hypothetical protein